MRVIYRAAALAATGVLAMGLASCASSGGTGGSSGGGSAANSAGGSSGKGTGSLKATGSSNEIVYFALGITNQFVAAEYRAMQAEAKAYGYKIRLFDSNFDQGKADQNVAAFLATGSKPAGIIWEPPVATASANDTRQLARVAPVVQTLQSPSTEGVSAYAGPNQYDEGVGAAKLLMEARAAAVKAGRTLHSKGGNLLYYDYIKGQSATNQRWDGFNKTTAGEPFNVIGREYNAYDPDSGYKTASSTLAKYKDKGIDFIFAFNLQAATGEAKAAKEAGLSPGSSTIMVSGDCDAASMAPIEAGDVFGSVVQPAFASGKLTVDTLLKIIATGKVTSGSNQLKVTADAPPVTMEPPSEYNYIPQPLLTKDTLNTPYWGKTYKTACEYNG